MYTMSRDYLDYSLTQCGYILNGGVWVYIG